MPNICAYLKNADGTLVSEVGTGDPKKIHFLLSDIVFITEPMPRDSDQLWRIFLRGENWHIKTRNAKAGKAFLKAWMESKGKGTIDIEERLASVENQLESLTSRDYENPIASLEV